jgi:hypothetical protein
MQQLEVSGEVRQIYIYVYVIRRVVVNHPPPSSAEVKESLEQNPNPHLGDHILL